MEKITNNETPNLCVGCGLCCKNHAGWYHPEQVLDMLELLAEDKLELLGKTIQIDAWDDSPPVYVLRPAHINSLGSNVDLSWSGSCVNHTDKGCSLSFETRPAQCQSLVVSADKKCKGSVTTETLKDIWEGYQIYFESYFKKCNGE